MTTEHQACGLGSFLPMSCRGKAEAFARRLQSRLQSLGRAASGDGALSPDESSWLGSQPEVTSNQPRFSSSSDSDVYFDFDLDCASPGSPVDEAILSDTLPDYLVNKTREFHCPPRSQCSSESGCVLSPSAATGTSPGSDSSDGPYFDPETLDSEISSMSRSQKSVNSHSSHLESISTQENPHTEPTVSENGSYNKINGFNSSGPYGERKLVLRRNFRNAAGFRISSPEKEIKKDSTESPDNASNAFDKMNSVKADLKKIGKSLSNESSTTDEYFECNSLKSEDSLSEDLNSLCVQDSGYPNTAESSRCNSQNESRLLQVDKPETDCSSTKCEDFELQHNIPNGDLNPFYEHPTEVSTTSELEESSVEAHSDRCDSQVSSLVSEDIADDDNTQNSDETTVISSSESQHNSFPQRPRHLTLDCSMSSSNIEANSQEITDSKKIDETEEEDDDDKTVPRVRRCSSLKTGKTPPGTPGRKKIVRFADVLGLDLADVRTFLDEIPRVPRSAYEDLSCVDIPDSSSAPSLIEVSLNNVLPICINATVKSDRCLIPLFQQPGGQPDFLERVKEDQVCLENALVTDTVSFSISGTVRVRNLDFHKSVHIRYTLDGWKTFADLQATYIPNSCDGFSDKFTFTVYAHTVQVGQRFEFAVRFQCKGAQFWDSNLGANYVFQCLPQTDHTSSYAPIPISPVEQFSSSFY